MTKRSIPDGFVPYQPISPFMGTLGPVFTCFEPPDAYRVGLFLLPSHCNLTGGVHGGVVATLCDITLARAIRAPKLTGPISPTANLNVNYVGVARVGEWLEVRAFRRKVGARLGFATAEVTAHGRLVATATGVFARPKTGVPESEGDDA